MLLRFCKVQVMKLGVTFTFCRILGGEGTWQRGICALKLAFKRLCLLLATVAKHPLLWVAASNKVPAMQTNVADAGEESRAWLRRLGPAWSWTLLCVYKFPFDNSILKMGFIKGQL